MASLADRSWRREVLVDTPHIGSGRRCHDLVCHLKVRCILTRVGGLVLEELEHAVNTIGQKGTQGRPEPIDPMISREAGDHIRTERSRWIDTGASVVCATDVGNENRDADTDGCKVGCAVLLDSQEVHCQDELRCEKHLQEQASNNAHSVTELVSNCQWTRYEAICDSRGRDGCHKLRGEDEKSSYGFDGPD